MTREEAKKWLISIKNKHISEGDDWYDSKRREALDMAIKALEHEPSDDMVSRGVFEQVKWERDVAIEQLKELGYGLGEKIRTDEDCISRKSAILEVQRYGVGCFDADEFNPEQAERFVISRLNGLPSIQPTTKENLVVEDCISKKALIEYANNLKDGIGITANDIVRLPSIQPKPKTGVLDKIRAEIHATAEMHEDGNYYLRDEWIDEIIDKYKAEKE